MGIIRSNRESDTMGNNHPRQQAREEYISRQIVEQNKKIKELWLKKEKTQRISVEIKYLQESKNLLELLKRADTMTSGPKRPKSLALQKLLVQRVQKLEYLESL